MLDLVIIGKGPAGLSAAIYAARAGLSVTVIGTDYSSLSKAEVIENYFGFSKPVKGSDLLSEGKMQAESFGVDVLSDEVLSIVIDYSNPIFKILTSTATFECKSVLIASGRPLPLVKIPGLKEFEGKGISYCTTCDGFFYKNSAIGILGNSDYAMFEAFEMETFTKKITIYTNGKPLSLSPDLAEKLHRYKLNERPIKQLLGDELLEKILFNDDTVDIISGLFIASERPSGLDFAYKLGLSVEEGRIITDDEQKTNIKGIYAAGDCTSTFKQLSVAVGQGAIAAKSIIDFCKGKI